MYIAVRGDIADQKFGPSDWVKNAVVTLKNAILAALTVTNKGSACWLQVFDCIGGDTGAVAASMSTEAIYGSTAHGFTTGQKVTAAGFMGLANGDYYIRVFDVDGFTIHTTFALAQSGLNPVLNEVDGDPGTFTGIPDGEPEEFPLTASGVLSMERYRFKKGIYVRGVTAADGATAIAGDDLKISASYSTHPLA